MIGNWLGTLHNTQLDRVLEKQMKPGSWDNCLVSVIDPMFHGHDRLNTFIRRNSFRFHNYHQTSVPYQYDALCKRFTTERINRIIRERILVIKLRRTECNIKIPSQLVQQQEQSSQQSYLLPQNTH